MGYTRGLFKEENKGYSEARWYFELSKKSIDFSLIILINIFEFEYAKERWINSRLKQSFVNNKSSWAVNRGHSDYLSSKNPI